MNTSSSVADCDNHNVTRDYDTIATAEPKTETSETKWQSVSQANDQ